MSVLWVRADAMLEFVLVLSQHVRAEVLLHTGTQRAQYLDWYSLTRIRTHIRDPNTFLDEGVLGYLGITANTAGKVHSLAAVHSAHSAHAGHALGGSKVKV